jgi:hypothetical protein
METRRSFSLVGPHWRPRRLCPAFARDVPTGHRSPTPGETFRQVSARPYRTPTHTQALQQALARPGNRTYVCAGGGPGPTGAGSSRTRALGGPAARFGDSYGPPGGSTSPQTDRGRNVPGFEEVNGPSRPTHLTAPRASRITCLRHYRAPTGCSSPAHQPVRRPLGRTSPQSGAAGPRG